MRRCGCPVAAADSRQGQHAEQLSTVYTSHLTRYLCVCRWMELESPEDIATCHPAGRAMFLPICTSICMLPDVLHHQAP